MDNLVAEEAMGRSLFRKRAFEEIEFEEVNKAEDEETSTRSEELLGTMEGNQAEAFVADREQLKEKLFPQINWDALRLDFDDEEWAALQASLAQNIERERNKTCEADLKETARKMKELEKRKAEEWEAMKKVDPKEIEREYLASTSDPGKYRDDWNAIWSRSYGSFEDTSRPRLFFRATLTPFLFLRRYQMSASDLSVFLLPFSPSPLPTSSQSPARPRSPRAPPPTRRTSPQPCRLPATRITGQGRLLAAPQAAAAAAAAPPAAGVEEDRAALTRSSPLHRSRASPSPTPWIRRRPRPRDLPSRRAIMVALSFPDDGSGDGLGNRSQRASVVKARKRSRGQSLG